MSERTDSLVKKAIPAVILSILALIYISPILANINNIGVSDWDSQFFYHAAPLKTIFAYGQFPLWNPYFCGGNTMLASPEISFLAPPYIFVLMFGEVVGVKLIIVFYTLAGMFGMYYLSRVLGFGKISSYLPPVIFMLSSWYALRISEGHSGFLPFALLPLIIAFYLKSIDEKGRPKNFILSGFFYAWTILAGGIYPFTVISIFVAVFGGLLMLRERSIRPAANLFLIVVITFLFSAVKSIPQFEFISEYPRKTEAVEFHSADILKDSLLSRNQRVLTQNPSFYMLPDEKIKEYEKGFWGGARPWGWQEYGAFIGVGSSILFVAGLIYFKRTWVWAGSAFFMLLLSLGEFSPVGIWSIIRKLPILGSLHGPSRVMPAFIFAFSIVAGYGLSRLEKGDFLRNFRLKNYYLGAAVGFIILELITVSIPVMKDAFTEPPFNLKENERFTQVIVKDPTRTNYPNFLRNVGVANCYESQHPPTSVSPYGDERGNLNPYYTGEAFLFSRHGTAEIKYFSPNRVVIEAETLSTDKVILNQNFFKGWRATVNGKKVEVKPSSGLVSAEVGPGSSEVIFYYSPTSFKAGLFITLASLAVSVFILFRSRSRLPVESR